MYYWVMEMKDKKKETIHTSKRSVWEINPKTRVKKNNKIYSRSKTIQRFRKELREE